MIARYPGLTAIGGLAMAFAIWVGIGGFQFYTQMIHPTLPLEDGREIVGITVVDRVDGDLESRILRDFGIWRDELTSVVESPRMGGVVALAYVRRGVDRVAVDGLEVAVHDAFPEPV